MPAVAHATFPGTNGKLAFGSARSGFPADNDLYTMAADGTNQTRITTMNLDELNPAWSPKGAKVAFERANGLRSDIWISKPDGTGLRQLTTHAANDVRPAFSNTGTKIVFASDRNSTHGKHDLFVMEANGANQVAITNTPTIDENYPSWSPDGLSIAFSRDGDIYRASTSGTNLQRLTSGTFQEFEPDWSPNGSKIVYRTGIDTVDDIWTLNASGGGHVNVTNNGSIVEERPVWSPQGDKIAFIRGAFKDAEVYTMNPDGTAVTRITNNTIMDASPSWQPIPFAPTYVRPTGAGPARFPLVPSYRPCKSPTLVHAAPLNSASCTPPKLYSRYLTLGTPDANGKPASSTGFVRLTVVPGNTSTPADEADVAVKVRISDVRKKSDLTDYTGQLRVRAEYRRQTDKENITAGGNPIDAGTSKDMTWAASVQCTPTADVNIGSNCDLTTTRDAITPGSIKESKRAILTLGRIQVWDGGSDGLNSTEVNDLFLTQGLFIP